MERESNAEKNNGKIEIMELAEKGQGRR